MYLHKKTVCAVGGCKLLKVPSVNRIVLITFSKFGAEHFPPYSEEEVQAISHWGLILKSLLNFLFGSSMVNFPLGCPQIRRN